MAWLGYGHAQALDTPMVWLVGALDAFDLRQYRLSQMIRGELSLAAAAPVPIEAPGNEAEEQKNLAERLRVANSRKTFEYFKRQGQINARLKKIENSNADSKG